MPTIKTNKPCPLCKGNNKKKTCIVCGGKGSLTEKQSQKLADTKLRDLYSGLSCYGVGMVGRYMTAEYIRDGFILIHHRSHAEYTDRVSKVQTCRAYHALVHILTETGNGVFDEERHSLLCFHGRLNRDSWILIQNKIDHINNSGGYLKLYPSSKRKSLSKKNKSGS
jgi:hypothetical protein